VRLRIEFGDKQIKRILLDGAEAPKLCTPDVNDKYLLADHLGVFGVYAAVSDNDTGPTLFGNFVFLPAENPP
jgi:hypothetical protein